MLGMSCVVSISNEFARLPSEPPYFIAAKHTKAVDLVHFAWADIRTLLSFVLAEDELEQSERYLLEQGAVFFWDERSGVQTYDAMPENWKDFVEASGTALGFGQNQKGLAEIVHGWQQERRDLASKLSNMCMEPIEVRHHAGARTDDDERLKADKKLLADEYRLGSLYHFKQSKITIDVLVALRSCRSEMAVSLNLPADKGARGAVSWLKRKLEVANFDDAILSIDWPGWSEDSTLTVSEFLADSEEVLDGQKAGPKGARLIFSKQDTRRFKSRKFFVADLEALVLDGVGRIQTAKLA